MPRTEPPSRGGAFVEPTASDQLAAHLREIGEVVARAARSPDPIVDTACGHLLRAGGKGFRPLVSVLSASAAAKVSTPVHLAAAACELLHLSTLYHDDVIDAAELRRGVPSVNRAWGERVAVVAGNRLTAAALEVASLAGAEVAGVIASTYRELVEGERHESQLVGRIDHGLSDYLAVIDGKTASLIAAAAEVGALAADAPGEHVRVLATWGRTIGQAYQIADDLLDLTATSAATGKPAVHDVRQGVFTLPVLDALEGRHGAELRDLLIGGVPYTDPTLRRVQELVRHSGAIARAARRVDVLLERADGCLEALPETPARHALVELSRSVVPRAAVTAEARAIPAAAPAARPTSFQPEPA